MKTLALILLIFVTLACQDSKTTADLGSTEPQFRKDAELTLQRPDGTVLAAYDIEVADDEYSRQTGLMYRSKLGEREAMLFSFPEAAMQGFYMKSTLIPLDLIFLDEDKRVVSFAENARPLDESPISSRVPAMYVLEVNGGQAQSLNLDIGDVAVFSLEK